MHGCSAGSLRGLASLGSLCRPAPLPLPLPPRGIASEPSQKVGQVGDRVKIVLSLGSLIPGYLINVRHNQASVKKSHQPGKRGHWCRSAWIPHRRLQSLPGCCYARFLLDYPSDVWMNS